MQQEVGGEIDGQKKKNRTRKKWRERMEEGKGREKNMGEGRICMNGWTLRHTGTMREVGNGPTPSRRHAVQCAPSPVKMQRVGGAEEGRAATWVRADGLAACGLAACRCFFLFGLFSESRDVLCR
jgi:hypothetical protein